jgi:hypothetical protein
MGGTEDGGKTYDGRSGVNDRMGREAMRNRLRRKIPAKEVRGTYGGRAWRMGQGTACCAATHDRNGWSSTRTATHGE